MDPVRVNERIRDLAAEIARALEARSGLGERVGQDLILRMVNCEPRALEGAATESLGSPDHPEAVDCLIALIEFSGSTYGVRYHAAKARRNSR